MSGSSTTSTSSTPARRPSRKVASLEYYDLLQIAPNATDGQIKKAYYRHARNCHPDKCGDDPDAAAAFQKLSHAYQVLSDSALDDCLGSCAFGCVASAAAVLGDCVVPAVPTTSFVVSDEV